MKKSILTIAIAMFSKLLMAQCCPYVFSLTVLPAQPISSSSNVKIVTKVSTPNQGSLIYSGYTINGQTINIKSCYWDGFATSPLLIYDTIQIGSLPNGVYSVVFTAYSSPTNQSCIKNDSNTVTTTFNVGEITSIVNNIKTDRVKIFPNPAKDKLFIENINQTTEVIVLNELGNVVSTLISDEYSTIDISSLKQGIYVLKLVNGEKIHYSKLLKYE